MISLAVFDDQELAIASKLSGEHHSALIGCDDLGTQRSNDGDAIGRESAFRRLAVAFNQLADDGVVQSPAGQGNWFTGNTGRRVALRF